MTNLIVVENEKQWPLDVPGTDVVTARSYLTDRRFFDLKRAKVFNLCRTYGYQTLGYYVSLLATARGHKPLPSVGTIQDMRQSSVLRFVSDDVEQLARASLAPIKSDRFTISIYFGRNLATRYDRLSQALFNHFPAPLLRAEFIRDDQWRLRSLRPIAALEIPLSHHTFVIEQAQRYFARPRIPGKKQARYDLAILFDPTETDSPSDERAIRKFSSAARKLGMAPWVIGKQDYGRVAEYDALFIRETTAVNHHTYRFASRAATEGLVVIDDPESIIRCTNKVYQAELFERHAVPSPRTLIVHKDNAGIVEETLGLPCVLKRPDSSFSAGVVKPKTSAELKTYLETFFSKSELVVAQEFLRSSFDWRVGVIDNRALYVCRYHMVRGHWQIQKAHGERGRVYGKVDTLALDDAPSAVVDLALRATALIGRGLYGVDIKDVEGELFVMEINDNPSIESGVEDTVLKDELYAAIMQVFFDRLELRGRLPTGAR